MSLVTQYSPKTMDELVGRGDLINPIIRSVREKREIPHLLLEGLAGTGKTCLAHCIGNELYGADKENLFFEMNASHERGIDSIREKVIHWASLAIPSQYKHKIIFLDESDLLTKESLSCLRRVIEDYSRTCRFIFACNHKSMIEKKEAAILSRLQAYHFDKIDKNCVIPYLQWIITEEKLNVSLQVLNDIYNVTKGDLRQCLHTLEQVSLGKSIAVCNERLLAMSIKDFYAYSYTVEPSLIFTKLHEELIEMLDKGKDISEAIITLADAEYCCAIATIGTLQVQSAFTKLKKIIK